MSKGFFPMQTSVENIESFGNHGVSFDAPIAFWSLIFLILIMFVAPQAFFPFLESLHLAFVSAIIAIGAYLASVLMNGRALTVWGFEVKSVLWLVVFALLSIPYSKWSGGSYEMLFDVYLKSVAVFFLISNLLTSETRLRTFLWALTLYSGFNAIIGINQYRTGMLARGRIIGGYSGITHNPNDLALALNIVIPFMAYLYLTSKRTLHKSLAGMILISSIACIVLTWSRSGAIAFMIMFGVFIWWRFATNKTIAIACLFLIIVLAMALAPQGYTERISSTTDFSKDDGSAAARWETTKAGFQQTLEHPFGIGMGMNGLQNYEEGRGWSAGVHNVYLEISTELGIIPVVIYIVLLFKLIRSMRLMGLAADQSSNSILSDAISCSLIGFAVEAVFSPVAYHFHFYILAGIAVATKEMLRLKPSGFSSTSDAPRKVAPHVGTYQIARFP
jgi:putative inorganic carbon (hco3(-)) transporter